VLVVGVLSTLAVALSAVGLSWAFRRYQELTFVEVASVEPAPPNQPSNWLLVGSDSREGIDPDNPYADVFLGEVVTGKRTDTIMVARVDPNGKTVDLLSVPRDLWVPISGTGSKGRVNGAFNGQDGEDRLVATVEDALGIEINNYAEVNFVGFADVVSSVGGVPIWFDTPMRDSGSGLDVATAGCHVLDGFDAVAFARSRKLQYYKDGSWHSDGTGDLGRTARQQYFLSRLAATAVGNLDLTKLGTVNRLASAAGRNLSFDDGAGMKDLADLARTFADVGPDGIRRHALPVTAFTTSGGAAVLDLNRQEAETVLAQFRPSPESQVPELADVDPAGFTVDVENGARIAGLAGGAAEQLRAEGFIVGRIDDAPNTVNHTVIRYPSTMSAAASTLGQRVDPEPAFVVDESLSTIVLVLGPESSRIGSRSQDVAESPGPEVDNNGASAVVEPAPAPSNEVGVVPSPGPEGTPCA